MFLSNVAGQVRALKDAFNTLTDAVLQDLENIQQEAVSEVVTFTHKII